MVEIAIRIYSAICIGLFIYGTLNMKGKLYYSIIAYLILILLTIIPYSLNFNFSRFVEEIKIEKYHSFDKHVIKKRAYDESREI